MRRGGLDTAAIEVRRPGLRPQVRATGEYHTLVESIAAFRADQSEFEEEVERMAERCEMPAEISARRITNAEGLNQVGATQATPIEILKGFAVAV